jgi:MoxR-like ATPase
VSGLREKAWEVLNELNKVILGKEEVTAEIVAAMLAGGHVLLEDIPGVGKTTLALGLSKVFGLAWRRVQFTPDVLPSDIVGFSIYRKDLQQFVYQPGTVFTNLFLADEINRTSPKTQSALLEVMEEGQVTVDGVTRQVPCPFFVIATQNPYGAAGTQMLPPAQIDRFMICMTMGYPDMESELLMAKGMDSGKRTDRLSAMVTEAELAGMQAEAERIYIHDAVYHYILQLVRVTREHPYLEMGASPRATMALVKMSRAFAWLRGRDYVSPEDVSCQYAYVVIHRLQLNAKARMEQVKKEQVIAQLLQSVKKPTPKGVKE